MRELNVGGFYKHFKGGIYQVIELALHTEDEASLVIYRSMENGKVFARPLDMFMSEVDKPKYPEADQTFRMEEFCPNDSSIAVMPRDFEKWEVLDIKVEIEKSDMLDTNSALLELHSKLVQKMMKSQYIPFSSYLNEATNCEVFRMRVPVGPWINMLK